MGDASVNAIEVSGIMCKWSKHSCVFFYAKINKYHYLNYSGHSRMWDFPH